MDTFTCGSCEESFTDLELFFDHKKASCHRTAEQPCPASCDRVTTSFTGNHTSSTEIDSIQGKEEEMGNDAVMPVQNGNKDLLFPDPGDGTIFSCKDCNVYATNREVLKTHCSELHNIPEDSTEDIIVSLQPLSGTAGLKESSVKPVSAIKRKRGRPRKHPQAKISFPFVKTGQVTVVGSEELTIVSTSKEAEKVEGEDGQKMPQRKRGRPRKTEEDRERDRRRLAERRMEEEEERKRLQVDEQNMQCQKCGKTFVRLRQLTSHRCQPENSDSLSESDSEVDEDDSFPKEPNNDGSSITGDGAGEVQTLHFDPKTLLDGLSIPEHEIPQNVNDNAIPDLRTNKSGSLKVYTCPVCGKVFKTRQNLLLHMSSHTSDKPFKCSLCSYSSSVKCNLQIHMRKHTNERLHCDVCDYSCFSKGNLKSHMKKHGTKRKPIYCELCNCRAYTTSNLLRHLEAEHDVKTDQRARSYYEEQKLRCRIGQRNLIYQCHICSRKFKDKRNHDKHVMLHKNSKPFKCSLCSYSAILYTALEKHARRHWLIYVCHLCQAKVLSLELLKTHLTTHDCQDGVSDSESLELSINASMYQSDVLEKELLEEHNRKSEMSLEESRTLSPITATNLQEENDLEVSFKIKNGSEDLKILNTPVVDKSELQEMGEVFTKLSFKRLSSDLLREIRALYGDNECPTCGKLFSFRPHLETHKRIHQEEKDFKCELCSYSSHSKHGLRRHIQTVHIATKLKCSSCDFETTSSAYLQAHMKKHLGSDAFRCTQCDMSTGSEETMKHHLATNHPELPRSELEKIMGKFIHMRNKMGRIASHKCQHCGKVFRRVCDLRSHIWVHNGINPYKCKLCKFATRNQSNLKSHMLRHSDTKNHLCDKCGKTFKMKSALKTHRMAQHPTDRLHCCTQCDFTAKRESQLKRHMAVHAHPPVQTFRCFQCTQFTNSKDSLREHYHQEHPGTIFDESLSYEIPEERITTLNISISNQDGVLHYRCSQCDVLLINNGELGQHLRDIHGLAITTSTDGEAQAEADPEQLNTGDPSCPTDEGSLSQGVPVHLGDSVGDDRTSAEQLLQQIIDVQEIVAQVESNMTETSQQQQYNTVDSNQDQVGVAEAVAAVNYLTTSENLSEVHGDVQHGQQDLQTVNNCNYVTIQPNPQEGSSEVIPDAVFEQEVTEGVIGQPEGQVNYIYHEQGLPT